MAARDDRDARSHERIKEKDEDQGQGQQDEEGIKRMEDTISRYKKVKVRDYGANAERTPIK